MNLVNRTPLAAQSDLAQGPFDPARRTVMVTAKATFAFDALGRVQLETQSPVPLFASEVPTELGLLPNDLLPRTDPGFEVVLLGKAYAQGGKPTPHRRVALAVGDVRHEIDVYGDRTWTSQDAFSEPVPFSEMPLTYSRAFGGTFDVLIDEGSKLRVSDPTNADGIGFDVEKHMKDLGEALKAPHGYPRLPEYVRPLPNLERPGHPIRGWADAPPPAGWATVPLGMGLHHQWLLDRLAAREPVSNDEIVAHAALRAHPDWLVALPGEAALVEMVGIVPFETVCFRLPRLIPVVDVLNGLERSSHALEPQMLVLLPEQRRFYLVYRAMFTLEFRPHEDRGLRLRTEERWSTAAAEPTEGAN